MNIYEYIYIIINQLHHVLGTVEGPSPWQLGGARPCKVRFSEFTIHCTRSVRQARCPGWAYGLLWGFAQQVTKGSM